MRERRFSAGDTVTQEGSGGVGFFIVQEGEADVSVGGESRGVVGPGDYFGEMALINESPAHSDPDRSHGHGLLRHDPVGFPPARREQPRRSAWKLLTAMAEKPR